MIFTSLIFYKEEGEEGTLLGSGSIKNENLAGSNSMEDENFKCSGTIKKNNSVAFLLEFDSKPTIAC